MTSKGSTNMRVAAMRGARMTLLGVGLPIFALLAALAFTSARPCASASVPRNG